MNLIKLFILMVPFYLFLTGCYDKTELEYQAYVVALGVDKGEGDNTFKFTYQIANPETGTAIGGGSSNEPASEIITVEGNDFLTATTTANASVSKKMTLDHTKVLVVSEEVARSDNFLGLMQTASRTTQIRRQVQIIVSKENARDFIKDNKPQLETRPHKYYQLMLERSTETGIVPESDIHRFFQLTEGDADLFLAMYTTATVEKTKNNGTEDEYKAGEIPKKGGNPAEFMGSAVFKEGKMIDVLDGQNTRLALIMDNTLEIDDLLSTYQDPVKEDYKIAGDFSKKSPTKVKIDYRKDVKTTIDVTVPFSFEVLAIPSLVPYSQDEKLREKLKASIEKSLEKKANKLIEKAQKEYGSDPFYWSLYIRNEFASIPDYEKADWNKKIWPNAEVNVDFQMSRLEFGKMVNDSQLNEVRD
ncbi:Ger(x)C family spore germination protein [Aquibacillus salsiterrae]|uniref:Ger(X)C family spore germination protein n=1 Tax=Aquibacillus salsiterrae TaxID=2950439 RepID=A0A9X3WEX1_9BACI|nr:Ger(x)C family spore germination protein [Aquibacillus salsiterrae]MDC3417748.1 Ger(x)C family spore germination protein [Aquibacillus salsiterrae]